MGINEIAEELGYVNQSYFGEIFKRDTGMSPSGIPAKEGGCMINMFIQSLKIYANMAFRE